jgi:uncharacterized protein with GYD domain
VLENALAFSRVLFEHFARGVMAGQPACQRSANPSKIHKEEINMPKYMIQASYSAAGVKGVLKEGGTSRKAAVEKAIAGMGGRLESFYYAFGKVDVFAVIEMPDAVSAAATSMAINASGLVSTSVTPLLTTEDIDTAAKKSVNYRAPGE